MLNLIVAVVKIIGGPGSVGFFILASLAALLTLRVRRRAGLVVLISLLLLYGALSLPALAAGLEASLGSSGSASADSGELAGHRVTLVVLGGDNDLGRDREVSRLLAALHPERAVILGDEGIGRTVQEARLPGIQIIEDDGPGTTRAQIAAIGRLASMPNDRLVVVASRLQMPRVVGLARAGHLDIVPIASDVDQPLPLAGWRRWCPSISALHVSRDALYERAALAYYRWHGWIG